MKFKALLLCSMFSLALVSKANAAQLTINGDVNLPAGGTYSNNTGSGFVQGIYANLGGSWIITTGGNINANNNISTGAGAFGLRNVNSSLKIENTASQNSTLFLNGNSSTAMTGTTDDNAFGLNQAPRGSLTIENMNIESSNNTSANRGGFGIENLGVLNAIGEASGTNYLKANDNIGFTGGRGIGNTGTMLVENMNIEANGNGFIGIRNLGGGTLDITGISSGTNYIQANNNKDATDDDGKGIISEGINSEITIKNMNIKANGNSAQGVVATGGGKINITGAANSKNKLIANNNFNADESRGAGIQSQGNSIAGTTLHITNMDIEANHNLFGIVAHSKGQTIITGLSDGSNKVTTNYNINTANNYGAGIHSNVVNSLLEIKNMDIESVGNNVGINAASGSNIRIIGILGGRNSLKTLNNTSYGIQSDSNNSNITIDNINIENNNNAMYGFYALNSGKINITGITSGKNTLQVNNNGSASGIAGRGIFSYGVGSEINIKNMNIQANGNGAAGISAGPNGKVSIIGSSSGNNWIVANNNGSTITEGRGIYVYGANSSLEIENMNIDASRNFEFGIVSGGSILTIKGDVNKRNSLIMKNNLVSGIRSGTNSALVDIYNMNIVSEGNTFAMAGSTGNINITDSSINVLGSNDLGFHIYNDVSTISLNNVVFNTASKKLINFEEVSASNADITGTFTATNSNLSGAIVTTAPTILSNITSNVNLTNTVWRNVGQSNITNYTANGVDAYMNVFFGSVGGGDLLTIDGTSSGATTIHVTSAGTDGSQSEVMVVDQRAATSAAGTFSLARGVVDSGAYEYELFKGDEAGNVANSNNYYLRSNGTLTNTAKTIANIPVINIHIAKTGMNELRKRMGELRDNDPNHKSGVWARSYAKNLKVNESVDSKMNIYGFEAGYDHQIYGDCDNKVYAGLMAGYSYTDNIKTRNTRALDGSGHANTPTIGAYVTWLNSNGWFADATLRSFWTEMDMTAHTSQGNPISFDINRQFTAGSLEAGRTFAWDANEAYSQWILEPKAELSYIYGKAKSFKAKGASVSQIRYGDTDSVQARGALLAGYKTTLSNGTILEPFVEAAIIQEFGGKTDIHYAGADYKSDISGTSYEFNLGLNSKVNNDWNFYGEVGYETGSVVQAVSTNIGVRYNF